MHVKCLAKLLPHSIVSAVFLLVVVIASLTPNIRSFLNITYFVEWNQGLFLNMSPTLGNTKSYN